MKPHISTTNSIRLRFAGLYLLSLVLILFILFPFLEGFSTKPTPITKALPVQAPSQENKEEMLKLEKAKEACETSLTESQNNLKDREAKIVLLESQVTDLQQLVASKPVAKAPQIVASGGDEKLKARVAQLEKQNATLTGLNNDLKRRNEYLAAQVSSQKK